MMSTIGKHSNYIHRQPLQRVTGERPAGRASYRTVHARWH